MLRILPWSAKPFLAEEKRSQRKIVIRIFIIGIFFDASEKAV